MRPGSPEGGAVCNRSARTCRHRRPPVSGQGAWGYLLCLHSRAFWCLHTITGGAIYLIPPGISRLPFGPRPKRLAPTRPLCYDKKEGRPYAPTRPFLDVDHVHPSERPDGLRCSAVPWTASSSTPSPCSGCRSWSAAPARRWCCPPPGGTPWRTAIFSPAASCKTFTTAWRPTARRWPALPHPGRQQRGGDRRLGHGPPAGALCHPGRPRRRVCRRAGPPAPPGPGGQPPRLPPPGLPPGPGLIHHSNNQERGAAP